MTSVLPVDTLGIEVCQTVKPTGESRGLSPEKHGRAELMSLLAMLLGILAFAHEYVDPGLSGAPQSRQDFGLNQAYLGPVRSELFGAGRLLDWNSVGMHGLPLLGHPHSQILFPPISIPLLLLQPFWGVRIVYFSCFVLASLGIYALTRTMGVRPLVAAWVGLLFAMSGTLTGRIYAGHVDLIVGMSFIPWVLVCILLAGRAPTRGRAILWGAGAGVLHGCAFLAGSLYVPFYLVFVTPTGLILSILGNRLSGWRTIIPLVLMGWCGSLALVSSSKLLAAVDLLKGASRTPDPFNGSQHAFWAFAHLVYPFPTYGPTLPWDSHAELPYAGQIPGPGVWGWWEYNQYIGVIPVVLALVAATAAIHGPIPRNRLTRLLRPAVLIAAASAGVLVLSWLSLRQYANPPLQYRVILVFLQFLAAFTIVLVLWRNRQLRVASRPADIRTLFGVCGIALSWLAIQFWYSPVHWLYEALPAIRQFQVPTRALIFFAIAMLALAAIGLEILLRATRRRGDPRQLVAWGLMLFALADVFLVTNWIPSVGEPQVDAPMRRLITELKERDPGPFVVHRGGFGTQGDRAFIQEIGENGVRVDGYLTPLRPLVADQPRKIGAEKWVRYAMLPRGAAPADLAQRSVPGSWEPFLQDEGVVVFINTLAEGDAYLVDGETVHPVKLANRRPGLFDLRITAPEGSLLVLPANHFPGWRVDIDGGAAQGVLEYDGLVAVGVSAGEHHYRVHYETPMLPVILALAALPWLVGLLALIWWMRGLRPGWGSRSLRLEAWDAGKGVPTTA